MGPAHPPHERYYATETNATVQQQQKVLGQQREDCHKASNMTLEYQSRKEVRKPRTSLMDPKSKIRIGCWSVRTMFETGKSAQVVNEMTEYRVNILGVAEYGWTDNGRLKLVIGTTVLYSG